MNQTENIKSYCTHLRLSYIQQRLSSIILKAQEEQPTYIDFLSDVLKMESVLREENTRSKRVKMSHIPTRHDLDEYDFNFVSGISERQLNELRQLAWLEQAYNIVLMGPSGTGKTYIAAGLIYDAIKAGKKGYLFTMQELITCLRTKDISTAAMQTYSKIMHADLLAIDDIMMFPVKKEDSSAFFNLINSLHEKISLIITTNKAPTEWAETLDDEVLASALLDRLLYKCEVIKLSGTSYRMENRQTIFNLNQ
ncbi:MAG: IS21-like element helper ATPase IstB [Paludibacteraceae bacterium]|nr:IS21-like element helper ATPase IstB [Paludibacteraceae bacterium]